MDSTIGGLIVVLIELLGAILMVYLVSRWTGASIKEILFKWDPRKKRPKSGDDE